MSFNLNRNMGTPLRRTPSSRSTTPRQQKPSRRLLALSASSCNVLFGWAVVLTAFVALYATSRHSQPIAMLRRVLVTAVTGSVDDAFFPQNNLFDTAPVEVSVMGRKGAVVTGVTRMSDKQLDELLLMTTAEEQKQEMEEHEEQAEEQGQDEEEQEVGQGKDAEEEEQAEEQDGADDSEGANPPGSSGGRMP